MPEGLSQPDPVPADTLQSLAPSTGSLSQLESGGAAQHQREHGEHGVDGCVPEGEQGGYPGSTPLPPEAKGKL